MPDDKLGEAIQPGYEAPWIASAFLSASALDRRKGRYQGTRYFRNDKSARIIIMPDWRGARDLRREYAFVDRAGLLNKTGFPVGVGFPRYKLYDFAHLPTKAGPGGVIPPMTAGVRSDANIVPRSFHNDSR